MEAYLRAFVNREQNNWAKPLLIVVFAFNNTKNAITGHIPFELNCRFQTRALFKKDANLYFRFRLANKRADELKELIKIYC